MIKSIEIENLRGISINTRIDLNNKSLIIFGENGKGKSSIVDGIEFAITGDIKHISSSCKEVTLTKHAPNILSNFKEIKAIVEFEDNSKLSNYEMASAGTIASKIKNSRAGNVNILRRAQLLDAIHAQPKDRYDLLKPFLPLGKINEYENALKLVIDRIDKEKSDIEKQINIYKKNIQTILGITDSIKVNRDNIIQLISQQLLQFEMGILNKLDEIPQKSMDINTKVQKLGDTKFDVNYKKIIDLLEEVKVKESPIEISEKIFKDINSISTLEQKEKIVFYEEFLKMGIKWLNEENTTKCPFCETNIDVDKVIKKISERILKNSEYTKVKKQFDLDNTNLNLNLNWWLNISEKIDCNNTSEINDIELTNLSDIIRKNISVVKNLVPKTIEDNIVQKNLPEWPRKIIIDIDSLIIKYNSRLLNTDTISKISRLTSFQNKIDMVYRYSTNIEKLLRKLDITKKRYNIVSLFYEVVVSQRKKSVQNIYDEIKKDINEFYNFMHQEEQIGNLNLIVKESTGKGSALIEASFYEKKREDPRAYFSEAHLDTLGLAIFLALYQRECYKNKNLRFIVLDDILTSVDAAHRSNIVGFLFTKFKDHQFIITTHDRTFYNEILEIENQYGGNNKFKNIEICEWDKKQGPILDESISEFEKLKEMYKNPRTEKNLLASKAGTFLELVLNRLRYSLKLSIPAQYGDKYTIADIWDNLYKVLSKNKGFYNINYKIVDTINSMKFLRNTNGCHYNQWAEGISKDEIKQFAKSVIEFYNVIYCEQCNTYIKQCGNGICGCKCSSLSYIKNIIEKQNIV